VSLKHRVKALPGHSVLSKPQVTLHKEENADLLTGSTFGPVAFKRRLLQLCKLSLEDTPSLAQTAAKVRPLLQHLMPSPCPRQQKKIKKNINQQ